MIIIMVIIVTIIICYRVCAYCFRLVLKFCSVSASEEGESAREAREKAYITVSIVTCSIVPEDVLKKYTKLKGEF